MPEPRTIQEPVQVVVEGKAMEYFFDALSSNMGVTEIQIQNFGGTSELSSFLKALRRTPGFEKQVTSLGIIRDAEDNPSSAFRSVQHALRSAKFTVPAHPEIPEGISPRVTILILPNATQPGMLETSVCSQ